MSSPAKISLVVPRIPFSIPPPPLPKNLQNCVQSEPAKTTQPKTEHHRSKRRHSPDKEEEEPVDSAAAAPSATPHTDSQARDKTEQSKTRSRKRRNTHSKPPPVLTKQRDKIETITIKHLVTQLRDLDCRAYSDFPVRQSFGNKQQTVVDILCKYKGSFTIVDVCYASKYLESIGRLLLYRRCSRVDKDKKSVFDKDPTSLSTAKLRIHLIDCDPEVHSYCTSAKELCKLEDLSITVSCGELSDHCKELQLRQKTADDETTATLKKKTTKTKQRKQHDTPQERLVKKMRKMKQHE